MMIVVVIIYTICWLPIHVITIAGDINKTFYNIPGMHILWTFAHWLSMSNCMYNPFIYCWMNDKFRNGFLKVLRCFTCGILRSRDDIELQRIHRYTTTSAYNHRFSAKTTNGDSADYTVVDVKLYGGDGITEASSSQSWLVKACLAPRNTATNKRERTKIRIRVRVQKRGSRFRAMEGTRKVNRYTSPTWNT